MAEEDKTSKAKVHRGQTSGICKAKVHRGQMSGSARDQYTIFRHYNI